MTAPGLASLGDSVVRVARSEGRDVLLEHEALEVVRGMGLRVPHHLVAEDVAALGSLALDEFPGPRVVLKALSPRLIHKTDQGAVAVVARRMDAVVGAARDIEARLGPHIPPDGFLVEEYIPHRTDPGGELLLGLRWTREFGAVVSLGLGGASVEFLARTLAPGEAVATFRSGVESDAVIRSLRGRALATLATGAARGASPGPSLTRLALLVEDALAFADRHFPDPFTEVEVNPLTFTPRGPMALDALVRLVPGDGTPPAPRRPPPREAVRRLLEPRTVALVGASERMNPGRVILRNLLAQGFEADGITVVKDGLETLDGCRCVPDLEALPEPVDLLILAVPAPSVPDLLERATGEERARSVVVIPGGLGEREGTEDRALEVTRMIQRARARGGGPAVNGGNCLGVRSVPGRINTLFIPDHKLRFPPAPPAPLAVVSQSGAFAVARASHLTDVNPRHLITVGNQVDLTVGDWLDHLVDDGETRVFACYVEGFQPLDGARFLEAAERITESGRCVVLYRAGRSEEGARAAASHTASVAGDWEVTRELATSVGVLVADTIDDFDGLVRTALALADRTPAGTGLGAMSNAGFEAVALADRAAPLRLVDFDQGTVERLEALLGDRRLTGVVGVRNPLDVTPILDDEGFAEAAEALLEDPAVDVAVVGCVPLTSALETLASGDHPEDVRSPDGVASRLAELWRRTTKPWVAAVDGGPAYDALVARLREAGIPTFRAADRAVELLARWVQWRIRGERP